MTIDSSGISIAKDLNLCKNMYTFTAVAITMGMNSSSSEPVAGPMNFSGILSIANLRRCLVLHNQNSANICLFADGQSTQ